jgi:hypothetical protein
VRDLDRSEKRGRKGVWGEVHRDGGGSTAWDTLPCNMISMAMLPYPG